MRTVILCEDCSLDLFSWKVDRGRCLAMRCVECFQLYLLKNPEFGLEFIHVDSQVLLPKRDTFIASHMFVPTGSPAYREGLIGRHTNFKTEECTETKS